MMHETLFLRRIFHRFFPRKAISGGAQPPEPKSWNHLTEEQKKELALQTLSQGELALLRGNLAALSLFETAAVLDPGNPKILYRQGLSFFEYGSEEGKEKALLLASKYFKSAVQLDPKFFDAWVAWGNVLLQLGRFHDEHHFHLEARDKYRRALELREDQPNEILGELHWDYGTVWGEIANHSGEALDFHLAIQAFQSSLQYQPIQPAEFWNDFGNAYLQLGLLINDQRLLLKAVDLLQKSVDTLPQYCDGWVALADTYAQLYVNTMNERFSLSASDCYAKALRLSPKNSDVWLSYAQLLAETGHLNKNVKALVSSVEKCARAATLDPDNSSAIAQWVESLSHLGFLAGRLDLLIEAEQKILKATDQFPDDPDLWHAYGICLMAFARYFEDPEYDDLAIEKLQFGLSIDRTHAEIWHALGLAHKHCADLTDEEPMIERAARFLSKAMDLKPFCPSLNFDAASSYLHYSETLDDLTSLEQAIVLFESLLQNTKGALLHHPEWIFGYARAIDWLGEHTGEEKDFARAIEIYSHVLLIDPDYPTIHVRMAGAYVQMGHLSGDTDSYKRAIHHFRLATRQEEENDALWLEWGLCLIHLAHHTIDIETMDQLYFDAEQKITRAGQLGNPQAYYHLACLYSILGQTTYAMDLIRMALRARALPALDEMLDDDWLENLRATEAFAQFLSALEAKLQAREQ
jgi:tetratricopeptide (TPR) repeat protein